MNRGCVDGVYSLKIVWSLVIIHRICKFIIGSLVNVQRGKAFFVIRLPRNMVVLLVSGVPIYPVPHE